MTTPLPPVTATGMWWVAVTPELAASWLCPRSNREVYHSLVDMYAERMRAGLWDRREDKPIEVTDGRVAEGWHRLAAIVQCGLTIDLRVLFR